MTPRRNLTPGDRLKPKEDKLEEFSARARKMKFSGDAQRHFESLQRTTVLKGIVVYSVKVLSRN